MVRRRSPSSSLLSPMHRLLLRMSPTMLPKRRRVCRIMAMVHIIRQHRANQLSHRIKSSPLLHHRSPKLLPTSRISRISHHTTNQLANQPLATAQASHTTTRRSPSSSQPQRPTQPTHKPAQTRHTATPMLMLTQVPTNPPRSPTSHKQAATLARHMLTHSSHSVPLLWLLPAQTLVQQASQTPPSR